MTPDQLTAINLLIAIIGQSATWVTVVIIFLTLREMARQRKQSLQPGLVIPRVVLHGAINESYFPSDWEAEPSTKDANAESNLKPHNPNVTIHNLGVGSATDIYLRWEFDQAHTLQTANQLCQNHSIPILFEVRNDASPLFHMSSTKDASESWTDLESDTHSAYDYLLPVSVTSKGLGTYLPTSYTTMVSILINSFRDLKSLADAKLPTLRLQLKYKDISGTQYVKKLESTPSVHGLSFHRDSPTISFSVMLEFKESN